MESHWLLALASCVLDNDGESMVLRFSFMICDGARWEITFVFCCWTKLMNVTIEELKMVDLWWKMGLSWWGSIKCGWEGNVELDKGNVWTNDVMALFGYWLKNQDKWRNTNSCVLKTSHMICMLVVSWFYVQVLQIGFIMHGKSMHDVGITLEIFQCISNIGGDDYW